MLRLAGTLIASAAGLLVAGSVPPDSPEPVDAVATDDAARLAQPAVPLPPLAPRPVARALAVKPAPPTAQQALEKGVLIVVSLPTQRMFVFKGDTEWGTAPVSTGRKGKDTPAGVFSILQKSVAHRSTLYGDAPMPYMQRLTWGGVAMHAGALPGYRASHGCIRLPHAFAKKLYGITNYSSTAVLITRQPVRSSEQARELGGGSGASPLPATDNAEKPVRVPGPALASADAKPLGGQTIQLGATPSNEGAADLWQRLAASRPELAGLHHAIVPAVVNGHQVFRLRASGEGAREVCGRLAASGTACVPVAHW